ncbi:insulin-like growth factor-binding protein 1 [Eptesicus fuscus]|uniref:insulin-like growth factor-binding protein 1 n=1 Tax=Eptesicus fuscus TaxID=29078 RepID=UPI002403E952|nr:insulin-like growth factor-binding protein 1 [Eptesicus fuscus]
MAMPAVPAASAAPLLLLLAALLGEAAAEEPHRWECAPCSAEKLAACPPVPESCRERARPYGCGCCTMCALRQGDACGMTSARCESGLSCQARPGETRPLRALSQGRGVCMPETTNAEPSAEATEAEEESPGEESPLWSSLGTFEKIQKVGTSNIKDSKEPCRRELYEVLSKVAQEKTQAADGLYKFYMPNCHRNGMYHSKQCMVSLHGEIGVCWCVYPWNGQKIVGSTEVFGDPNCDQYFPKADAARPVPSTKR